jgi:hypothetical protein
VAFLGYENLTVLEAKAIFDLVPLLFLSIFNRLAKLTVIRTIHCPEV